MSKLNITRISLLLIDIVLLLLAYLIGLKNMLTPSVLIMYLSLIVIVMLSFKDISKKNKILDDKRYNILSIVVFIFVLIILARTFLDSRIVTTGLSSILTVEYDTKILFLSNNIIYFDALFISLIIYRITCYEKLESYVNSKMKKIGNKKIKEKKNKHKKKDKK